MVVSKTKSKKGKKGAEDSRDRVLSAAETLFNEFGYTAVTVQHIAKKLDIKAASLYYHAPGGKEELYMMVIERALARHRKGIETALELAEPNLRAQFHGIISWFLTQGPLGFLRLLMSDLAGLATENGDRLRRLANESLIQPILDMVNLAVERGEIKAPAQPQLLASSLLSMVDGIWYASTVQTPEMSTETLIDGYVNVLIDGLAPR